MVGIRAALSHSSNMDICGGGGSAIPASGNAIMGKNNNLTIQVNDPGQQDVVSQPSGTVIVNCYKDTSSSGYREESESSVCIKVQGGGDNDVDKEGKKKRCNVNSAKKSRSTQCEDHLGGGGDQLFVGKDNEEISVAVLAPRVNDQSIERSCVQNNAVRDESAIKNSDHANVVIHNSSSCSGLDNSTSSSSSTTTNQQQHHQIETDTNKDTTTQMHQSSRKSFKSTEAQTDNNFLQPNQTTSNATEQSSSAASVPGPPPSAAAASMAVAMQINPGMAGQSREERRRERRERRQNRAQNQAGRHCHPNVRVSSSGGGGAGAVPPYEILPDLVNNPHPHTHHLLPPPYSTLPLGSTMSSGGHHHPPPIIPRMPVAHHHHHHMAIQRLRSTSPPPLPTPLIMQAPPPPGTILQPVPVASIANVGDDPRFLFQLPVIRR